MNELKVLQYLVNISFCVQLKDFFQNENNIYIVTKQMKRSLKEESKGRQVEESEVLGYIKLVGKCLSKLHKKNIVHRDLRMESI